MSVTSSTTPQVRDMKGFLNRLSSGTKSSQTNEVTINSTVIENNSSTATLQSDQNAQNHLFALSDENEIRKLSNYEKSLESIKQKNGGQLPSDLYTKTNTELTDILYGLTGKMTVSSRYTSKEVLVKRILKLTATPATTATITPVGVKRPMETQSSTTTVPIPPVKKTKKCLDTLTSLQIIEMKRILAITPDRLDNMKHDKHLRPLWYSVGMTAKYPHMTGKETVMEKMKDFSLVNLRYHGHI